MKQLNEPLDPVLEAESLERRSKLEETLKPCPLCESQSTFLRDRIACDCCLCEVQRGVNEIDEELAQRWNTRKNFPINNLVDAVRKLISAKGRYHTELSYKEVADALREYDRLSNAPYQDNILARITAKQEAFEAWAVSHGGFDLTKTDMYCDNGWAPATYKHPNTEIAWRAAANTKEKK